MPAGARYRRAHLHKGCRLATTFYDLPNHWIFDVVEGKAAASLEAFLLSLKGRDSVKWYAPTQAPTELCFGATSSRAVRLIRTKNKTQNDPSPNL